MKVYALYKGEDCLAIGTIPEIAKEVGIKEDTVRYYLTPSYIERTSEYTSSRMVRIEDDDE